MKNLDLAEGLTLPLEVVTEKLAWLGRTGSGKTYGAMKLAELMLAAGARIGVIDAVGVWRALRVPAEKGGESFEVVVFGGLSCDLPLEPTAGELVADLIVDRDLSFVLDVSQMIPAEQQRFVKAFADRFFHRKKSQPGAVHLFMEECQEFLPENPSGAEVHTLGAMQRMWKLGRNFGIGGSLISQRPQEIAKKALNMSGTLFAFQMTGPHERAAVKKWIQDHDIAADIEGVLQKLKRGAPHVEMFFETQAGDVYQHSGVVNILPRVTADLSSTPKVLGGHPAAARALTPIDIEKLKASMAATIERQKATDPRELQKQLAEQKKLVERGKIALDLASRAVVANRIEVPILKDAQIARIEKAIERLSGIAGPLGHAMGKVEEFKNEIIAALRTATASTRGQQQTAAVGGGPGVAMAARPHRPAPVVSRAQPVGDVALDKAARKVLGVLAQYPEGCNRRKLTILAGYRWSGGFRNSLSALRSAGLIVGGNNEVMRITEAGAQEIGDRFELLPTGADLLAYWKRHPSIDKAGRAVLDALAQNPIGLPRAQLCALTGYEWSGGFRNSLSTLRTAGLIVGSNGGVMQLSDELAGAL